LDRSGVSLETGFEEWLGDVALVDAG
jgi:hypothetical protein